MKLPALSLFFLVLVQVAYPQDTIRVYYDKDWNEIQQKDEAEFYRKAFWDNNHVWTVKDYYKSHHIQMTGSYKSKDMKVKQGHYVYYHENGNKSSEGNYINDKAQDQWTIWYENGQIKSKGNYVEDKLEGTWEYWFDNGKKKSTGNYLKGEREGIWRYWYKSGPQEAEETYRKGQVISATGFFENGMLQYKGGYVNGERQGEWTYWNVDGRVYFKGKYAYGRRVGEWIRSFPEGEMKLTYKNGNLESSIRGGIVLKNLGSE